MKTLSKVNSETVDRDTYTSRPTAPTAARRCPPSSAPGRCTVRHPAARRDAIAVFPVDEREDQEQFNTITNFCCTPDKYPARGNINKVGQQLSSPASWQSRSDRPVARRCWPADWRRPRSAGRARPCPPPSRFPASQLDGCSARLEAGAETETFNLVRQNNNKNKSNRNRSRSRKSNQTKQQQYCRADRVNKPGKSWSWPRPLGQVDFWIAELLSKTGNYSKLLLI